VNENFRKHSPAGTVYLVGAGPGDPDLLTLKAAKVLAKADIVFHDELVAQGVLAMANPAAQIVNVGKRAGMPSTGQDQINRLLADAAFSHPVVVRLKGGDPFIFGRGGEELDYLQARGVPVEIVPGITAALGCAAQAGLPLTFRNEATRLTLLTAHRAEDALAFDYAGLAAKDNTLAIYMGKETAARVAAGLIAAGRSPETPVAVIVNGTLPDERWLTGTLAGLGSVAARAGSGPALIVIGEVIRHSTPWREALDGSSHSSNAA
jgi:uroporphyrin-III C-methyltransferase/precorrin-2 dehydrogenase/sirohydrochlorin ferrochelatase